jgi:hypothetical protein
MKSWPNSAYRDMCLDGLMKTGTKLKVVCVPGRNSAKHVMNTNQKCRGLSQLAHCPGIEHGFANVWSRGLFGGSYSETQNSEQKFQRDTKLRRLR